MAKNNRITIITGSIDSGKTSWCNAMLVSTESSVFKEGRVDGILSPKVLSGGIRVGYDVKRISTGERVPLARVKNALPPGWKEAYFYGTLSFSEPAFDVVKSWFSAFPGSVDTVVMDEIGPLEIGGAGFGKVLEFVLKEKNKFKKIYIVIRKVLVESVCLKFNIENYEEIKVEKG
ncbi:MAG: hypothetical protein GXP33_12950 [Spirochaetes bacterium]|nr:hypothetical protein [Spirochaetota bacterium]